MHRRPHPLVLCLVSAALMVGCARNDGVSLPPLVDAPSPELPGKFVWHNLVTPDADAARTFYRGLFGWELEIQEGGRYTVISYGGRHIGGIVDAEGTEGAPRSAVWLAAISVTEVDATVSAALEAGATQLLAATDVPDVGRLAVISDPQGAVLQLLSSTRGDPPDIAPPTHHWLWHELIANDPEQAAAFYARVFGYRVQTLDNDADAPYRVLNRDGAPRAGIVDNPFEQTRPAWIPYVRVEDPAALLPAVTELGGRIVVAPREDLRDGTVALILDPSGAPVALQRWNPEPMREGV